MADNDPTITNAPSACDPAQGRSSQELGERGPRGDLGAIAHGNAVVGFVISFLAATGGRHTGTASSLTIVDDQSLM